MYRNQNTHQTKNKCNCVSTPFIIPTNVRQNIKTINHSAKKPDYPIRNGIASSNTPDNWVSQTNASAIKTNNQIYYENDWADISNNQIYYGNEWTDISNNQMFYGNDTAIKQENQISQRNNSALNQNVQISYPNPPASIPENQFFHRNENLTKETDNLSPYFNDSVINQDNKITHKNDSIDLSKLPVFKFVGWNVEEKHEKNDSSTFINSPSAESHLEENVTQLSSSEGETTQPLSPSFHTILLKLKKWFLSNKD